MTQIEQVVQQIKSEFRLDEKGRAFVTIRGAARLADIDSTGLSKSLSSSADQNPRPLAKFLTAEGFDGADLNHWSESGIPDIALALILEYYGYEAQERYRTQQAKLCCRAFRSTGIRAWVQQFFGWEKSQSSSVSEKIGGIEIAVKAELDVLKYCLDMTDLDNSQKAGIVLNHAGERMPQLESSINRTHSLIAASNESDLLLTPTRIGKELGISSRKVNIILVDLGYQIRNANKSSKTEPDYLATELGRKFASNTAATGKLQDGKADNTTYQHLKWKPEIIGVLQEHIANQN